MNAQRLNLFIVDDNPLVVKDLTNYLDKLFGSTLNISSFNSGATALQEMTNTTHIVILDYHLEKEDGNEVLARMKKRFPLTKVIMLSSNETISVAIESFRNGASEFIVKGEHSWIKISHSVKRMLWFPVRVLVKELGVSTFFAVFIMTFITVGCVVLTVLYTMSWNQK